MRLPILETFTVYINEVSINCIDSSDDRLFLWANASRSSVMEKAERPIGLRMSAYANSEDRAAVEFIIDWELGNVGTLWFVFL